MILQVYLLENNISFYVPFVEIGDYDENASEMGKPFCLTKDFHMVCRSSSWVAQVLLQQI